MPQYKTTNLLRRKRVRLYVRSTLYVLLVVSIVYGIVFWSRHPSVQITSVEITGNTFVTTESIHQRVSDVLSKPFAYVLNRNNALFISREKISNTLEQMLPIDTVYVRMTGLRTVSIEIIEHVPVAIWCADATEKECYFINKTGLMFVRAPAIVLPDLVRIDAVFSGEPLGQQYATPDVFGRLYTMITILRRINIGVSEIASDDYETFTIQTKNGPQLLVDKKDDPLEVVNNLKTLLEQESIHDIQFQNIEYVDLRFTGKAYYKIK